MYLRRWHFFHPGVFGEINHQKCHINNVELFALCVVPAGGTQPWLTPGDLDKQEATAGTFSHATGVVVVAGEVVRVVYVVITECFLIDLSVLCLGHQLLKRADRYKYCESPPDLPVISFCVSF